MARRDRTAPSISLFPFLSVLACVIGTLTLMITALSLGQMDNDTVASAEEFERVKKELEAEEKRVESIEARMKRANAQANEEQQRLIELRQKLQQLMQQQQKLKKAAEEAEVPDLPVVDEKKHKEHVERLQEELKAVKEEIEKIRKELAEKKKPPEEAVVRIRPSGSGVGLKPTFVECTASAVVLFTGDKPTRVSRGSLSTAPEYLELLDSIAKRSDSTIVFLVRDDAIGTYRSAASVARSHYARNGKLPVIGHGKVDLSLFGN